MNLPNNIRSNAYRDEMKYAERKGNDALWHFYNANLALDELKQGVNGGLYGSEGPSSEDFDHVEHRFERAIDAAEKAGDMPAVFSARLMKAYIKPIAYADIINMDILRGAAARNASANIGLHEAVEQAYEITTEALMVYDELSATPRVQRPEKDEDDLARIVGFLGEVTPLLFFGGRHRTSKWFATPALAYDDRLSPNKTRHIDIDFYDNRVDRKKAHHLIQMKTSISEFSKEYDPEIAVLYAHDFGNDAGSMDWPLKTPYTSLHALILERQGVLPKAAVSQLDRIASRAYSRINSPQGAHLLAAGMNGAYKGGRVLRSLIAANKLSETANESIAG
jgi:hypothetical protein